MQDCAARLAGAGAGTLHQQPSPRRVDLRSRARSVHPAEVQAANLPSEGSGRVLHTRPVPNPPAREARWLRKQACASQGLVSQRARSGISVNSRQQLFTKRFGAAFEQHHKASGCQSGRDSLPSDADCKALRYTSLSKSSFSPVLKHPRAGTRHSNVLLRPSPPPVGPIPVSLSLANLSPVWVEFS